MLTAWRKTLGFTLAELLVSIGLIVLFTAVLLPSISRFGRRNELTLGAQLAQSRIGEAKGLALGPRASGGANIIEYAFVGPANPLYTGGCTGTNRYAVVEITQPASGPSVREDVQCADLPYGMEFVNAPAEVRFAVLAQGAVTPAASPDRTFIVRHTRLTDPACRTIVVAWVTGQVTVQAPANCP